ncbi:MAG: arginine--tRNA ligase [Bacteroidota bacterium]
MKLEDVLSARTAEGIKALYGQDFPAEKIAFQKTNQEFEGDITLVVFPFLKLSKKGPEQTAGDIGEFLKSNCPEVAAYNVVKGFLNLVIADRFWVDYFSALGPAPGAARPLKNEKPETILLEYCGPNTNKPLHLGHVRNILLGWSVIRILEANGHKIIKANIVNDRGVHICKSMLAWQKWGHGESPRSAGMKGDHLVGKYYVEFDKHYKAEVADLEASGLSREEAEKKAPLIQEVQEMLRKWEAGDTAVLDLWNRMNGWVYEGFEETYKALGVSFDKVYYESQTYKLGKKVVEEGVQKNIFHKRADNSIVVDLKAEKLDEKVLLRSDGTSVYITQDIGTAVERVKDFPDVRRMIYTVGNEQEYHFKVLFKILKKLGYEWADNCYHLSYGMVELPEGKMKSREGTVVDADDLINEMIDTARETTEALGKIEDFEGEEAEKLYRMIGLAALKYFILKVDPKKKMLFNPKESIDFNGNTGPFIQYTYARIQSVFRKGKAEVPPYGVPYRVAVHPQEKELIKRIYDYPAVIAQAAREYNPSVIANYVYELAKDYNLFYHDITILKEQDEQLKKFRLALSARTGEIIRSAMDLLGITVPERM